MKHHHRIESFFEKGFSHFVDFLDTEKDLRDVENEICYLGREFFGSKFSLDYSIPLELRDRISPFYDSLRYATSLRKLSTNSKILELVSSLGLAHPIGMNQDNIRMDEPSRDEVLFHWHQDITYLLGSKNSVTLWIPLGKTDLIHGSIGVKEMKEKKIYDFEVTNEKALTKTSNLSPRDVVLSKIVDESDELVIDSKRGDLIAFSQFVLHRSRANKSNLCRWTIQLRYSDLLEPGYINSGMPMGDRLTILNCDYYGEIRWKVSNNFQAVLDRQTF
jgi:hypothetical protein